MINEVICIASVEEGRSRQHSILFFFQSYMHLILLQKKEMRFQVGIQLLCTISRLFYVCMMLKENPLWSRVQGQKC